MKGPRSVSQLLGALLTAATFLVLLVGIVGVSSEVTTTRSVDFLTQQLRPAVDSNARFLAAMLDSETELRAYAISGEMRQLHDYRTAIASAPPALAALEAYSERDEDARLDRLVDRQSAAGTAWVHDFARQEIRNGGGPGSYRKPLYELGVRRFDRVKALNAQVAALLHAKAAGARADAQHRLRTTVVVIATVSLLGGLLCLALGVAVIREVRRPLKGLEQVVARISEGDLAARAKVEGPREIRGVAVALNELADENARGRDVEALVQARLHEVDAVKSDFVSNVSHELRTPLTIIVGYLELLEDDLGEDVSAQQAGMLRVTHRNVQRLRELIEDLLALTQLENVQIEPQPLDVGNALAEVVRDMQLAATARGISLAVDVAEPVVVEADPSQLHRALLNVVANAVKFSDEGGQVRLGAVAHAEDVEISVADDGMGIPAAELSRLGSRFFRASNAVAGEISGTGLGLRIVQTILDRHDGTLEIASVEGEGTVVVVRLPRVGHERPADGGVDATGAAAAARAAGREENPVRQG